MSDPLLKTYAWRDGRCWAVSTINRESSAIGGRIYAETMVFDCDPKSFTFVGLVWQGEGPRGSVVEHLRVVSALARSGATALARCGCGCIGVDHANESGRCTSRYCECDAFEPRAAMGVL